MKAIKKFFIFIIAICILLYFSFDWIVKKGAEYVGSEAAGVEVFLNEANVSFFSDKAEFEGIIIGNPQGFDSINAFEIRSIKLDMNLSSIFSEKIIINEIIIDSPDITYEKNDEKASNVQMIFNNVRVFSEVLREKTQKVQIYDFIVKNGKIDVKSKVLEGKTISTILPDINVKDIGRDKNGKTIAETINILVTIMDEKIMDAVSGPVETLKRKGLKIIDNIKGLIDKL